MSNFLGETALTAYRGLGHLAAPFAGLLLAARTTNGKEDAARRGERLGMADGVRPAGPLVWVHAASVGETMSVIPVVDWLAEAGITVLLTSGTVTSATLAAAKLPKGAIHQYVPLDVVPFISRFLDHWRPMAALFVESEVWPTTVSELHRRGIPQVLVNARLSSRSMRRWLRAPHLARAIFGRCRMVLAQSDADAARFARLGVADVAVTGNIKFDCQPLAADTGELARLRHAIGDRPVLLAASTHPGEEEALATAIRQMAANVPGLLSIIVPRHPDRRGAIAADLATGGFAVAMRSRGDEPQARTDIYLADTLGELGLFYRLAPVAFIGGSLSPVGGHNPIEAAQLGAAVLHGPHVQNAREIFSSLDRAGGALMVRDAAALAEAATRLLTTPAAARAMARAGADIIQTGRGALNRTMELIAAHVLAELAPAVNLSVDPALTRAVP